MKQFVVIGCGRFGASVATSLYSLGYDVLAIDKDEEKIQDLSDHVTHAVAADAIDENALRTLGIRNFDVAVVSIASDIQASIMATLIAKELGVKTVIAKAHNDLHGKVLKKIGADRVVFPEREMGLRVAHNLVSTNILDYIELAPDYSIVEISTNKEWVGKALKEIGLPTKYGINVMAIKHGNDINITPYGDDVIREGDVLIVIGSNEDLRKLERR
ncbi:potassium channel family protein [Sporosalibacterium faouarense]|uniref:potassium channel family protein n=1 Tax=Sporosalibacterium faouarense TaxID=516123 RepID=UPI00141CD5B1|nr:TrkA family potassium uptake protein [Sporosalibacterium faouarense]MTI49519.1 TrkA family potassium uptake protein [Bacillota bacterium]